MNIVYGLIVVFIGYLFGCIQTSYILGKTIFKMDIRDQGSNNAGASNAFMILGWKYGVITGLVDVAKGATAVLLVRAIFPSKPDFAFLSGLAAVAGHIFPFYLQFKGGKGVAALIGMLLGYDWRWGVVFAALMVVIPLLTDYIAVGSLTVFTLLPILTYVLRLPVWCISCSIILTVVVYVKHWSNVQRIRNGKEVRIRDALKRA